METDRQKIIMVDDDLSILTLGKNILKMFYEVFPAPSAAKLFKILDNVIPDLILLDIDMPETNGFEIIKQLKSDSRFDDIPVIFLTSRRDESSELKGFDLGAVDYIAKPFSGPILLRRIANQLLIVRQERKLRHYADTLEEKVTKKTAEVTQLQNAVLATVADLVEFRDKCTGGHVERTQLYMKALLEELLRRGTYREEVLLWDMNFFLPSVQLHDVGKIAISDLILNKPAKLTAEEREIMKTHVTVGVDAVRQIMNNAAEHAFLRHSLYITGAHHEKWDGTGYPGGLKSKDIPLEGRLMAIADVYDALISERPYKKPLSREEARKIIIDGAGTHFDPVLVDVFAGISNQFAGIVEEVGS
jgi:putative two-component system response regulator